MLMKLMAEVELSILFSDRSTIRELNAVAGMIDEDGSPAALRDITEASAIAYDGSKLTACVRERLELLEKPYNKMSAAEALSYIDRHAADIIKYAEVDSFPTVSFFPSMLAASCVSPEAPHLILVNPMMVINTRGHRYDVDNNEKGVVATLVHELRHIQQFNTGRLTTTGPGPQVMFDGKVFPDSGNHLPFDEYLRLPWEVDADAAASRALAGIWG